MKSLQGFAKAGKILFAIGLPIFAAAVFWTTSTLLFIESALPYSGIVIEVEFREGVYHPVVEYQVDGALRTVKTSAGSNPSMADLGEEVVVLVDPNGKTRIGKFAELWVGPLVVGFFGIVITGVGLGIVLFVKKRRKKRDDLMTFGRKISATVSKITVNPAITVNGQHPNIVICTARFRGKDQDFKSRNLWHEPKLNPGDPVHVYFDNRNDKTYWVDC